METTIITIITLNRRNLNNPIKHSIISTINSRILREASSNKHHLLFSPNKKFLLQLISLSLLSERNPTSHCLNHSHNSLLRHLLSRLKVHLMRSELQILAKQLSMEGRKVQIHFKIFSNKVMKISSLTQVVHRIISLQATPTTLLITLDSKQLKTVSSSRKLLPSSSRLFSSNLQYSNQ